MTFYKIFWYAANSFVNFSTLFDVSIKERPPPLTQTDVHFVSY